MVVFYWTIFKLSTFTLNLTMYGSHFTLNLSMFTLNLSM
jgi:hypothetical protein